MARFRFLGEHQIPGREGMITDMGKTLRIDLPRSVGGKRRHSAPDQARGFVAGADIGIDVIDPVSIAAMKADPRFQLIGA